MNADQFFNIKIDEINEYTSVLSKVARQDKHPLKSSASNTHRTLLDLKSYIDNGFKNDITQLSIKGAGSNTKTHDRIAFEIGGEKHIGYRTVEIEHLDKEDATNPRVNVYETIGNNKRFIGKGDLNKINFDDKMHFKDRIEKEKLQYLSKLVLNRDLDEVSFIKSHQEVSQYAENLINLSKNSGKIELLLTALNAVTEPSASKYSKQINHMKSLLDGLRSNDRFSYTNMSQPKIGLDVLMIDKENTDTPVRHIQFDSNDKSPTGRTQTLKCMHTGAILAKHVSLGFKPQPSASVYKQRFELELSRLRK